MLSAGGSQVSAISGDKSINTKSSFSTRSSYAANKKLQPLRMSTTGGTAADMLIANIAAANTEKPDSAAGSPSRPARSDSPQVPKPDQFSDDDKYDSDGAGPVRKFNTQLFKKNIVGDLFGSSTGQSLSGLMYRSRIIEKDDKKRSVEKSVEKAHQSNTDNSIEEEDGENDSENETKVLRNMNPKQQLAITIKNWSVFPENDEHIIKEGAVYALIALSHIDDTTIRRCCASAFFHLSSRPNNREELLNMGITNGVTTLAIPLGAHLAALVGRKWKIAKLCTLTLCNLSMQPEGESIMANEYAIMALMVLVGINGHSLLPICAQTMYNMTSCTNPFKGIERIIKLLLNTSLSGHDHSEILVKVLVNCSRYSWLRLRIIEEGGISQLHSLVPTLNTRDNKKELVHNMLTALRSLSESSGCRADLLQKGSVELLSHLLPICQDDEQSRLLTMKIVHNFVHPPTTITNNSFEITVQVTTIVALYATDITTIQYCSACFNLFTKEKMRGMKHLAGLVINAMNKLLQSTDSLTQFFAISSAGNLFFNNLCNDSARIEQLVKFFVMNGEGIRDPPAKQALALALAKLSQDESYMDIIERLGLLDQVLKLLMSLREVHRDSLLLQESCCIAICRIALRLGSRMNDAERNLVTNTLFGLLKMNDRNVLSSAISGIRALGVSGLCPDEFIKDEHFLSNIAEIILRFRGDLDLCRYGCAVLAVFSYDTAAHDRLAEKDIMNVLFSNINSEDDITRELVANSLCNLSVHPKACQTMIGMNVVEVLGQLSCSTSETILDLCAKSLCNLTCNEELHKKMIQNNVLEIIIMIALVRTVSSQTKCTCAKALLNLVSDENLPFITESGAIRVFASLSTSPFVPVQTVCSKGFHLLTLNLMRRVELVKNRTVVQALFHMIKSSTSTSSRVKIRLGISVVNLLSCPQTGRDAIQAGALSCLKIIATLEFEELRDAVARVILRMASDPRMHSLLFTEPIVAILLLIIQRHTLPVTFELAVRALRSLSSIEHYRKVLIRDQGLDALIGAVFSGKVVRRSVAQEICRAWTHLSYLQDQCEGMIRSGSLALALHILQRSHLATPCDTKMLMLILIRNISESVQAREYILLQGIFSSIVMLVLDDYESYHGNMEEEDSNKDCIATIGYAAVVRVMYNLSQVTKLHEFLMGQGIMTAIQRVVFPLDIPDFDEKNDEKSVVSGVKSKSASVRNSPRLPGSPYSGSPRNAGSPHTGPRPQTKAPTKATHSPGASVASEELTTDTRKAPMSGARLYFTHNEVELLAKILNTLAGSPSCHESMVAGQVMEIFKALIYSNVSAIAKAEIAGALARIASSRTCREALVRQSAVELLIALSITSDANTQSQCAMALGYLSEITKVSQGVVASLLLLGLNMEDAHFNDVDTSSVASAARAEAAAAAAAKPVVRIAEVPDPAKLITLKNLLRDLMPDRIRFDSFVDALKNRNVTNLDENEFHPKHVMKDPQGNSLKNNKLTSMRLPGSSTHDPMAIAALQVQPLTESLINGEYTRLAVAEQHKNLLLHEETRLLKSTSDPTYYFETPQSQDAYVPEAGGLSRKLTVELPLPGIPTDRDLEPANRHKELISVPVDQNPLPKDCRVPVYSDHVRMSNEISLSNISTVDDASTVASDATGGGSNAVRVLKGGGKKKKMAGHARSLGLIKENSLKNSNLDPRSPLYASPSAGIFVQNSKQSVPSSPQSARSGTDHSSTAAATAAAKKTRKGELSNSIHVEDDTDPMLEHINRAIAASQSASDLPVDDTNVCGRESAGFGIGEEEGDHLQQLLDQEARELRLQNAQELAMNDNSRQALKGKLAKANSSLAPSGVGKLQKGASTRFGEDVDDDSSVPPPKFLHSIGKKGSTRISFS